MADSFTLLYSILDPFEQKKCASFFAKHDGEKEKAMFSELKKMKERSSEDLAQKIYGDKTKAPHVRQLRKQVTNKLVAFVQDNFVVMSLGSANVRRLLDFADFLIGRHSPKLALEYLIEAENEAIQNTSYDLLESIYGYKLIHAVTLDLDAKKVFDDWQQNNVRYLSFMHLTSANGILIQLLEKNKREGIVPDQEELMSEFYNRFKPNHEERMNPDFMLAVAKIFRKVMLSTKDYWRIEPAIKDIYETLIANNCFSQKSTKVQRSFLLMLSQACYRNANFEEAEDYLKEMQALMPTPVSRNDPHYVKMQSQRAAIYTYTNRCDQAIEILRKHLYGPDPIEIESERNNMQLNLAVNYFCVKDYIRSLEQLERLDKTDLEYFGPMGFEWVYKKRMILMIVHRCANHFEEAEQRLKDLLSDFEKFLKQDLYDRAKSFMEFALRWFENPSFITNPDFHREIKAANMSWGDREDIQAIFFFCWFRAAMLGQEFYPTFQARLKKEGKNWDYPFSMV
jgi:tetratricopeptide (TPR) repeat protein